MISWWLILLLLFGSVLILLFLGLPIAFSLGFVSIVAACCLWWPHPFKGFYGIALSGFEEMTNYLLICVPLFILMAEVIFRSGMGGDTYEVIHDFLSRLPGGLAMAAVVFGMIFGACCGASTAGTATVGLLSIPEMKKRGYYPGLAGAIVAFAGALSILIPPSVIFILYGVLSGTSIGALFMGGVIPGVIGTFLACIYIYIRAKKNPSLVPPGEKVNLKKAFSGLWKVWAMLVIVVALLGAIYLGVATPTEASALACLLVFLLAAIKKRLTWEVVRSSIINTVRVTTMIGWIIVGAMAFGYVVIRSGAAAGLTEFVANLDIPVVVVIFCLMIMYLIMGMFIDPVGIVLMTVPVLMPVLTLLDIDPLWFGVMVCINMCAGNISPPMGLNIYIVKGIDDSIPMSHLFKEAWPLVGINFVVILLVLFFPSLATWLPSTMR